MNHLAPSLPAPTVSRRWSCASDPGGECVTFWPRDVILERTVSWPDVASAPGCRSTSATPLDLAEPAVHLWWARLDGTPPLSSRELAAILSPEERRRAEAFLARRDRQRFVVRRCLLRQLLAGYVGGTPYDVALATGPKGRPELPTTAPSTIGDLCFSCSHSRGRALYGFTRGRRIGVDVEAVRPIPELPWIIEQHFASDERQWVAARSGSDRLAAFFAVWTCKEAVAKALGDGLTRPLAGIEVDVWTGPTPRLLALDGDGTAAAPWTLGLRRRTDTWAAVAVERRRSDETGRPRDDRSDVDGATHQGATRWSTTSDSMTAHASGDVPGSSAGARNRRPPARHRP